MAPEERGADGGAIDLEKKRGLNPWVIFGIALFVVAFVFGRRSVAKKTPDLTDDSGLPGTAKLPS